MMGYKRIQMKMCANLADFTRCKTDRARPFLANLHNDGILFVKLMFESCNLNLNSANDIFTDEKHSYRMNCSVNMVAKDSMCGLSLQRQVFY
ncbi:hypothetical protein CDAR_422161 [Caerostris darwini]|uniref:Uncharacterized protein n=1 Tax=Caerostris darwini TaxID=1538125 RepID=A0AAV4WV66_9ARAC|nr:hypothetical protein CDAR_422161 [Caerostris darwini]